MRPSPSTVHPRTRGEHRVNRIVAAVGGGSSPHTRGTPGRNPQQERSHRFIPAHAGNTVKRRTEPTRPAVHPRTRGEHAIDYRGTIWDYGSSPHTRGTRGIDRRERQCQRFIPAHAGNTAQGWRLPLATPVHPRTRGEHGLSVDPAEYEAGSSPHTRGTRTRYTRTHEYIRFIPAHAGNTTARMELEEVTPVHPRTRGEHLVRLAEVQPAHGSSPHTRGTRSRTTRAR